MFYFRSITIATFMSVLVLGMPALSHAEEIVETLYNPLQKTVSSDKPVQSIAKIIINALFGIAGSVALAMFVWGGFLWLTSAGNSKRVESGKQVFIWASLGIVMMFSSYAILNYIFSSLTNPSAATAPPIDDVAPPATGAGGGSSGATSNSYCCTLSGSDISKRITITASDIVIASAACTKNGANLKATPGKCADLVYCTDAACGIVKKSECPASKRALTDASCKAINPASEKGCTDETPAGLGGFCMENIYCTNGKITVGKCSGGATRTCCVPN